MSLVEKALEKLQRSREHQASGPDVRVTRDTAAVRSFPEAPESVPAASRARVAAPPVRSIVVNWASIREAGLLPPADHERQLAGQYRQIKRPLLAIAQKTGPDATTNSQIIMVSSAMPGDGKTFTALNLALSIAKERDFRVLLVDADVAKPHVSRLFGIEGEPGLIDALSKESVDVESLILATDVPGLSLLPAGHRSDTATELLSSQRMARLAKDLASHDPSRIVIMDTSPLLLTNESRALSRSVGQVVVVVSAGKTLQRDLLDALSHIDPDRAVGLVLNLSMQTSAGHYYGYGDSRAEGAQT